jgi:translation initiation factor 6 (eIF-6)
MQFKKPTVERPVKKEDLADVKKELEKDILNITQNGFNVVGDVELVNHSATTMSKTLEVPSLTQTSENTSTLIELNRLS